MFSVLRFVGRYTVENQVGRTPRTALISIAEFTETKINESLFYKVLRVNFHDVVPGRKYDEEYVMMDESHAKKIAFFVAEVAQDVDEILVNCKAGISRSPAVVKWIAEAYGLEFNEDYDLYNRHVYKLLTEAVHQQQQVEFVRLWMAKEVLKKVAWDEIKAKSLANLARWKSQGNWGSLYDEWEILMTCKTQEQVIAVMTGMDEHSFRLRGAPPYVGLLSQEDVLKIKEMAGNRFRLTGYGEMLEDGKAE